MVSAILLIGADNLVDHFADNFMRNSKKYHYSRTALKDFNFYLSIDIKWFFPYF